MTSVGRFVPFLVFLRMEPAFRCLTPLRFAAGTAEAFIVVLADASMEAQSIDFVAVSFLTSILIRPVVFLFNRHMADRHRRVGGQN